MKVDFVFSDPHFAHGNCIRHDERPFKDIDEMDSFIIDTFNSIVSRKSTVVFTGDIAWKNHNHYIQALNGKKILALGNHDKMKLSALNLFSEVRDIYRTNVNGQDVSFSHYPMLSWASSVHGSWNIHGHCHGSLREFGDIFRLDASCNVHGYRPLPWEYIEFIMKRRHEEYQTSPTIDVLFAERNLRTKTDIIRAIWKLFKYLFRSNSIPDEQQRKNRKILIERNDRYWKEFNETKNK